jgi:hypothetical protein
MAIPSNLTMQAAALPLDDPAWNRQRHRMAVCLAISAAAMFLVLATVDWPPRFDFRRLLPLELEVTLRGAPDQPATRVRELPQADPRELPQPQARPLPDPATRAMRTEPAERPTLTERPTVSAAPADVGEGVDWFAELERVAAEVTARAAEEPKSMHPDFDELRRIAALRYSKPQTNKPPSAWEAEKDSYGRTLLRRGSSYMILEDPSIVNRYAFETFERHMIFFTIPFGRPRPKDLPWVETIRARYDYLDREPDELPVLKGSGD